MGTTLEKPTKGLSMVLVQRVFDVALAVSGWRDYPTEAAESG